MKYRTELFLGLCTAVCIPVAVTTHSQLSETEASIRADEASQIRITQTAAERLSFRIHVAKQLVRMTERAASEQLEQAPGEITSAALQTQVKNVVEQFPLFLNLHIDDPTLTSIAFYPEFNDQGEPNIGQDHTMQNHLVALSMAEGTLVVSPMFRAIGAYKGLTANIYMPIDGSRHQRLGVVSAAIDLSEVGRTIRQTMPEELGSVVYDNLGKELYPTPGGSEYNPPEPLSELKVHLISDPLEPSRKIYAVVRRLPDSQGGWQVMTFVDKELRDAQVRHVWITSLGLLVMLVLVSLLFAVFISRRLSAAVDKLMRYLERDETKIAPADRIRSPSELRRVQESMEVTGQRLREKTEALTRLNLTLERQVQERTEALSRSNQFLHSLFESLADGVVVMDAEGRCRTANQRARELLGEEAASTGGDLAFLLEGYDAESSEPQSRMFAVGGRQLETVRFSLKHAGYEEDAVGCLLHDATEREALSHMKTTLISMAAHELRTPVQAIRLLIDTLIKSKKEGAEVSAETQRALLTDLEESSLHLQTLIADWLDVARIARRQCPGQQIVIEVDEDAEGLIGEANRLQQLFLNLFTNSARYARAGVPSRVLVDAGVKTGSDGTDLIHITVADNGIGVADEDAERIFDRFYQVQRGNRRRSGGTGLGLVIARAIAKAHGGRIWLQKGTQSGAVFVIELPVGIDGAEDEAPQDAQEDSNGL